MTRDLATAIAISAAAALGMIGMIGYMLFRICRRVWQRMRDDEYGGELVDISSSNWNPL